MVSIIIPVYNVSSYLSQCLDSIISQTYKDLECIIIDDGSTDDSGDICDEYAKKDSRITVFHQNNQGLAKARYEGLKHATGEYISVIDSDDWIEPDFIEKMVEFAEHGKYDIVISNYFVNTEDKQVSKSNEPSGNDIVSLSRDVLQWRAHAGLWNKLFRRSLLVDNNILPAPADYFEDMYTYIMSLCYTDKVGYNDISGYHYRYNQNSLTNDKNTNKRLNMFEQFLVNLCALYDNEHIINNNELRSLILEAVNDLKKNHLEKYYKYPRLSQLFKKYLPHSCDSRKCHSLNDYVEKVAFRFGWIMPYKIYLQYKLIRHYIHIARLKLMG